MSLKRKTTATTREREEPGSPEYGRNKAARSGEGVKGKSSGARGKASTLASPGSTSHTEDDDDGSSMQAMLEHLKQVAQKKSSKHREKLEHVLESSFRQVETTLHNALKDEESKFQQGAEKMNAECSRLSHNLTTWSRDVYQASETYNAAMKSLATQFDKMVSTFVKQMQAVNQEALASDKHEQRMERLLAECKQIMNNLKAEVASKPEGGGMNAKTLPLLLQAFMN